MKEMEGAVRRQEASWLITSVSSQDEKRREKVQSARSQMYKVLFTTMILERGVTFENVSVVVLGANHPVFTKSALVQIAGRVDRKGAFTEGEVIFFYDQMTEAIRQAIKELNEMNQLARSWLTDGV
nr:helicase-related protein [Enterococcus innesii]